METTLKAGAMQLDITPPIGLPMAGYGNRDHAAEAVLEPLQAVALAFEQGPHAAALVVGDLIGITPAVTRLVRARVASLCSLTPAQICICATHTHWGPILEAADYLPTHLRQAVSPEYTGDLALRLASAIVQAWNRREPAVALAGTGKADLVSFNRRPVGPDGKVVMSLTLDPEPAVLAAREGARLGRTWIRGSGPGQRLGEPLPALQGLRPGVTDPALPVLKLVRPDGTPIAAALAFGCHAVCGADPETFYQYSPDWPGQARVVLERLLGCPAMVLAGPCGDQVPRVRRGDARRRIGYSIGAEALRVWELLEGAGSGPLGVARRTIQVPLRDLPTVAAAEAALAARPDPKGPGAATEREILGLARRYAGHRHLECEIWAMSFGRDWGLVGLPGEILCEIGLQIKQQSPLAHTAVVELALACPGYFPTDAARAEGGYEPTWSPAGPGAEAALVAGAVAVLGDAVAAAGSP